MPIKTWDYTKKNNNKERYGENIIKKKDNIILYFNYNKSFNEELYKKINWRRIIFFLNG